jgi:D-amino-acid dehydrogenase
MKRAIAFLFNQRLAERAKALGVRFHFNTPILGIEAQGDTIAGVRTSAGLLTADCFVACLGSYTPQILAPLGLRLPVHPVKGCCITVPIADAKFAPKSTIMDETHKVAVTRLTDLVPRGGAVQQASFWCGLRPMTPDGTPVMGSTCYPQLLLAMGHGSLGWTMAAGTGRLVAELVSGRVPDISLDGLTLARYGT